MYEFSGKERKENYFKRRNKLIKWKEIYNSKIHNIHAQKLKDTYIGT